LNLSWTLRAWVDAEAQGRPAFSALKPGRHDVGDQRRLVHGGAEISFVEVAGQCADPVEIGMRGSEDPERRQEAGVDQVLRRRGNDEVVIVLAETARPRRRRQADERHGQRREALRVFRQAADGVHAAAIPHLLPNLQTVDLNPSELEAQSIENRDLFGLELYENGLLSDRDPDKQTAEYPFVAFLRNRLAECVNADLKKVLDAGRISMVLWEPTLGPNYHICLEEAAELVGGDADAAIAIMLGFAPLHERPKGGSPAELAEWARGKTGEALQTIKELIGDQPQTSAAETGDGTTTPHGPDGGPQ
jgi:hypothetical protein